jgi:exodeoxyribonuclease VII large subunit
LSFDFTAKPEEAAPGAPSSPPSARAPAHVTAAAGKPAEPELRLFTVAQLGRALQRTMEKIFVDPVFVEGEVGGARPAASGHCYFTLKDDEEDALIDVVVYRSSLTPRARALITDGARLRVRGRPAFWSPRGRLQFVADRIAPAGKGALLEALERLKEKLAAEGLFAAEKKRALPHEPRVVGVVTSRSGAAIHDVCKVAFRRGGARILLAPAQVQGLGAAEAVRRSLRALQRVPEVDVIIVGRGGGSQEDLAAFNDEHLVRDVAACRVPVVSAVGHEVDVTLVDFAADARAATPSQAAEMVVPDAAARRRLLEERAQRLGRAMHARITEERVSYERLARAMRDPRLLVASAQQLVDDRVARLARAVTRRVARERGASQLLATRLAAAHPRARVARDAARARELHARLFELARARLAHERPIAKALAGKLDDAMRARVRKDGAVAGQLAGRLDAMSPLKVLGRGYAIATRASDGRAVRAASEVAPGERVRVRVADGAFEADVTGVVAGDAAEGD